jgi:glycerol-3-phosphate dehydrogenase
MAIAEYITGLLADAGLDMSARADLPAARRMPNLGETTTRPYQDTAAIAADRAYGTIVCFCERVTEGEIRDACTSVIPPSDLGGLARRTRATNGRCQGFYCAAAVTALAQKHGCCRDALSPAEEGSHA